jgi:ABC-type oligopeptide transport system substrate-binding subunit
MRTKRLRDGAFGSVALLVFLVFTAGAGATSAATTTTLRIAFTQAAPDPFDPPLIFSNASLNIAPNVFEGLVTLGTKGKVVPALAQSWTVSRDGLTYTFQLRRNARFQNGDPVTAEDFVYSLNRAVQPRTASPISFYLAPIQGVADVQAGRATEASGIRAVGANTLRIVLNTPQGNFLRVLSRPVAWVVDRKTIEQFGNAWVNPPNVNGTGPYVLSGRTANTNFVFTANPRYWGKQPAVKRVELTVVPDSTAALARFQSGEFDVVDGLSTASVLQSVANPSLQKNLRSLAQSRTNWLGMRTDRPPFNKQNVRLAFQRAIDKRTLVRIAMGGLATAAKDWIPIGLGGNINRTWRGFSYDPALARRLLAAGGYPNGQGFPPVTIYYSTEMAGMSDAVLELIQQQLKSNLGVDVSLRNMPRQALTATLQNANTRPLMWAWTFGADIPDATTITSFFGLTGAPFNFEIWSNPTYDSLIKRAVATSGDDARDKLFAQAELIRMRAGVVLPLYYPNVTWIVRPNVKGFGLLNNANWMPFTAMSLR